MQHRVPSKNWKLIKATLGLAIAFLFFAVPQRSLAIYAAIIAKQNINISWNGSFVDSFDSANPLESTNGQYDPANPGDNGAVISTGGFPSAISIQNADIYGPVAGLLFLRPGGGVGTHAWLSTNFEYGIEPGYYFAQSPDFGFPTVTLPYTTGVAPGPGTNLIMLTAGTNILVTDSPTPPPLTGTNQIIACTTNTYYVTNSNYPGPMPGLSVTTNVTVTSTNTIVTSVTNCSSTLAVYIGTNPPPPEIYCPGTTPMQRSGNRWYYYPITDITDVTNPVYTFSTNVYYIWEQTNYDYQIYQPPTYQTNLYDHILCGNYCAGSLAGVTLVTCPSTLVMTNGLDLTGMDTIIIMPGASLLLYVDGGGVTIGGGGITNISGLDTNLQIYCTPAVSSLALNTATPFSGAIVAPDADITINESGSVPVEFSGNIMANSLTEIGVVHLHGDEAVTLPTLPGAPVVTATVSPPSVFSSQMNPVAVVGWQVTFSAWPDYSGASLQWFFNETNLIANATNLSLSLSNVTAEMAGEYTLQESGPGLFVVSQPASLTVVATPAATLNSFSVSASNQFQFNIKGLPGYWYDVEGSSNLIEWAALGSRLSPFTFTDTNQPGLQYFYRAVYVGP